MKVAIAAESNHYDPEVYRFLLGRVLGIEVERWKSETLFSGWKHVRKILPNYLDNAADAGVRHALVAIDNDGGADGPPEHESDHRTREEAAKECGCRTCVLLESLPLGWRGGGRRHCVVVPVQTLETWLLCVRGHEFTTKTPEQFYGRRHLKRLFFGKPMPEEAERARLAIEHLARPGALDTLRERRSFRFFEMQVCGWQP